MLIKNIDETLVNGSLGTVEKFSTPASFDMFGAGGDIESGLDGDPKYKKRFQEFSRQLEKASGHDSKEYPVVRFHAADGTSGICSASPRSGRLNYRPARCRPPGGRCR